MFHRIGSVALVAMSYALVLITSSSVLAISSDTTTTYLGCFQRYIGDGDCDLQNDTEFCDYDGGDCCECTCVSTDVYTCGENGGYSCLDPSAECVDDDDVTTLPSFEVSCTEIHIADGDCDERNNNEECGYDGGDCCECTCASTTEYTCGDNGGYNCLDPSAACFDDDTSESYSYDMSMSLSYTPCFYAKIGDGDCNTQNNNEECGYDGGDCCECTCNTNLQYACGYLNPFQCVDPAAPCINGDDVA